MVDVFAHGMLSMAYLGSLLTQWRPQARLRRLGVRFVGITHLHNEVVCTGRVVELVEEDGEMLARIDLPTTNQYGDIEMLGDALVAP